MRKRDEQLNEHQDGGELAVFLLRPKPPESLLPNELSFHPMLDNGLTDVRGFLWMVGPVVRSGKALPLDVAGDDEVFDKVVDDLDLGTAPAVVFDPRPSTPLLRYYEKGLAEPDKCNVIELRYRTVTVDDAFAVIDRVYSTVLATPGMQNSVGRVWENARKSWPKKDAERIVQVYLQTAFNVAFPAHTIRPEQSSVSGRLDLEIEYSGFSLTQEFIRHVIIELKVLREFHSTGTSVSQTEVDEWISDGVEQVEAYGRERGAVSVALCCFDMRKSYAGNQCFVHVKERAELQRVHLRCWHLFASAQDYRRHHGRTSFGV